MKGAASMFWWSENVAGLSSLDTGGIYTCSAFGIRYKPFFGTGRYLF